MKGMLPFYATEDLEKTRAFYEGVLGFSVYKDQGTCLVFETDQHDGVGFCTHMKKVADPSSLYITYVTEEVDEVAKVLLEADTPCLQPPHSNEKFHIYQALFVDPNGYTLEIQRFLD